MLFIASNFFCRQMNMIPKRLKDARLNAKMSQEQLGVLAGIDESTARKRISHYETGRYAPDYSLVCEIAHVLDVPEGYFYTKDDYLAAVLLKFHRQRKSTP